MVENKQYKLHPFSMTVGLIKNLKNWSIPIFIVYVVSLVEEGFNIWYLLFAFLTFLIPVLVYLIFGLIKWLTFRYWFEDGEIRVKYGLFVKKKRFIPFDRIQSFNYKAGIFHRIFGLVQISIETAGGKEPEVVLTAITKRAAEQIEIVTRQVPQQNNQLQNDEEIVQKEITTIFKMSVKDLFILATTSSSIGLVLSGLGAVLSQIYQYIPYEKIFDELYTFIKYGFIVIAISIFIAFFIVWLISVIITFINYYDFTVVEEDNRLIITRGLLEKKRITIPLNRVQAIKIIENPIRQWIGHSTVVVESIGGNYEQDMKVELFPLISKKKMYGPLEKLFPEYIFQTDLIRPTKQGRPFFYRKELLWLIPIIGLCSYFFYPYGLLSVLLLPIAVLLGIWQYKTTGIAISNKQLLIVSRVISRVTFVAQRDKIQVMQLTQSYFQKRKNVASVGIAVMSVTNGGTAVASHLEQLNANDVMTWFERRTKIESVQS